MTWTAAAVALAAAASGCSGSDNNNSSSSTTSPANATTGPQYPGGASASSAVSSASAAAQATVGTASVGGLGTVLVDGKGRTLYLFEADTSNKSTCTGGCAVAWPPLLTSGSAKPGSGAKGNLLGTTTRSGGLKQVTYHGHPLYLYIGDAKNGQASGQGLNQFGALWYVVDAGGNKVTKG